MSTSTSSGTITERLQALMEHNLGADPSEMAPTTTLEELEVDSLTLVELSIAVQKEFGILVEVDDLKIENTVEEIVALVSERVAE